MPKVDSHKNDQPQPSDVQCKRFEQFSRLPTGLRKYVAKDLIGTSLEDIDPFYKDKQVTQTESAIRPIQNEWNTLLRNVLIWTTHIQQSNQKQNITKREIKRVREREREKTD